MSTINNPAGSPAGANASASSAIAPIADLPPEEAQMYTSLLDDAFKSAIDTMFLGRAEDDRIDAEKLVEMMAELQVSCDPDALASMVPGTAADNITLQDAYVIIGRFVDMAHRAHAEEQARVESGVAVSQATASVVYLSTLDFVLSLTPCFTREDGIEYRWQKPKLDLRPKTTLMLSVSAMMIFTVAALVVSVVALNEQLINRQADTAMRQFAEVADATLGDFQEGAGRQIIAESLLQSADSLQRIVTAVHFAATETVQSAVRAALDRAKAMLQQAADDTQFDTLTKIRSHADTIQAVFSTVGSAGDLVNALKKKLTAPEHNWFASLGNSTVLTALCDGGTLRCFDTATNPAFAAANQVQWHCGQRYLVYGVYIRRLNVAVCVMELYENIRDEVRAHFGEIATLQNQELAGTPLEVLVGVQSPSGVEPLGARKYAPTLCVRTSKCSELVTAPLLGALADPNYRATRRSYDGRQYLMAGTNFQHSGFNVSTIVQLDYEHVPRPYGKGIDYSIDRTTAPGIQVLFSRMDDLRNILLLPENATKPTESEREYLTFASNGRTGLYLRFGQGTSDIVAGYSYSSQAQIAVGVQLSGVGVSMLMHQFAVTFIAAINTDAQPGWEVIVYVFASDGTTLVPLVPRLKACANNACNHPAAQEAVRTKSSGFLTSTNYAGDPVSSFYRYVNTASPSVVIAEINLNEWPGRLVLQQRLEGVLIGCIIILVVVILVYFLAHRVMHRIEQDYSKYKQQIEEEKAQFSELVKDVMPPYIAERVMKGTRLIAETNPQLTFFFSDIVGSTETSKSLSNKQLVRMLGYTFMLEDEVASYYRIHKIKTIGDAYFAVSGLEDSISGVEQGSEHQVFRMAAFACVTQQLIGPTYTHYPEHTELFRVAAGGADMGPLKMVRMRMGIHTGPAVAGVLDVGRAPHFDCFGPSVNLASRMESTSIAGRVQISGPSMEVLQRHDKNNLFEFDAPRRTLVKGYGTMTTYMIKATNIHVPETVIDKLKIERAQHRQFFDGTTPAPILPSGATPAPQTPSKPGVNTSSAEAAGATEQPTTPAAEDSSASPSDKKKEKKEKKEKKDKAEKADKDAKKRTSAATAPPAGPVEQVSHTSLMPDLFTSPAPAPPPQPTVASHAPSAPVPLPTAGAAAPTFDNFGLDDLDLPPPPEL